MPRELQSRVPCPYEIRYSYNAMKFPLTAFAVKMSAVSVTSASTSRNIQGNSPQECLQSDEPSSSQSSVLQSSGRFSHPRIISYVRKGSISPILCAQRWLSAHSVVCLTIPASSPVCFPCPNSQSHYSSLLDLSAAYAHPALDNKPIELEELADDRLSLHPSCKRFFPANVHDA